MSCESERRAAAIVRGATRYTVRGECWVSTYSTTAAGYAQVGYWGDDSRSHMLYAHRAAWEHYRGPLPTEAHLDHLKDRGCTSLACIRPDHLEPVTRAENARREGPRHATCANGRHPRKAGSWTWREKHGHRFRSCLACESDARARRRARYAARRAA